MAEQVAVFIDGFNLYYGLRSKGWRRYYWLDLRRLAENLLRPGQDLALARYFTARLLPPVGNPGYRGPQSVYLDALETLAGLHIHYGYFLPKEAVCAQCGAVWQTFEEKMTDVNIATELLGDAQDDAFDTAIIVSGDSDLSGPISALRRRYPGKRVVVAFPPNRISLRLRDAATAWFTIGRDQIRNSQFPQEVTGRDGHPISRPPQWS